MQRLLSLTQGLENFSRYDTLAVFAKRDGSMEHPSELIDSNVVGKLTYLPSLMGLKIVSCDVTIVCSEYSFDLYTICRTRTKSAIDRALTEVCRAEKSFSWWTGFDDDYPHCKNDLLLPSITIKSADLIDDIGPISLCVSHLIMLVSCEQKVIICFLYNQLLVIRACKDHVHRL
jgi:hypothetical protein